MSATIASSRNAFEETNSVNRARRFRTLVVLAVVAGIVRRPLFGLDTPLWLDEAFTGAIAIQPTFEGLVADCLREIGGPVYYSFMWLWVKLFGASNLSLRLPSLIFGVAAPVLILLRGHPDKLTGLLWAAIAALYIPSFHYATDARAYTLLFLLGTAQVILFLRMFATPSLRRASLWTGVSALFLLTHYHAAMVTVVQGVAFLLMRRQAWRSWPAALAFAPVLGWMAFHLPLALRFSAPGSAWQKLLVPSDLLKLPEQLFGIPLFSFVVVELIVAGVLVEGYRRYRGSSGYPVGRAEAVVVAASLIAIAAVVVLGFVRPSFTPRYLLPFMPGALLGMAVWTRVLAVRFAALPWLVLAVLFGGTIWEAHDRSQISDWRARLSWERASTDLMEQGAGRLFFTWDNPTARVLHPDLMARVGSFFFTRAGVSIPTRAVSFGGARDSDPNVHLPALANRSSDAFIWVSDRQVERTLAIAHPPVLPSPDSALRCADYSAVPHGVVACIRTARKLL